MSALLEVEQLSIGFSQYDTGLRKKYLQVISDLNLNIRAGEMMAVVGSSGSGKSLLAHAILGILPGNANMSGELKYQGQRLTEKRLRKLRGKELALIPQSVSFLDPLMKIEKQVRIGVNSEENAVTKQHEVFQRYQLKKEHGKLYPFQLSGGMARRALVATAVVGDAQLIIADEPTPGLHPDAVTETLGHLRELADDGRGVMLITHDIGTALDVADRIAIFYAGTTVEIAPAAHFVGDGSKLQHPYTRALWRALPQNDFEPILGSQPSPQSLPQGCLFAPRCSIATAECHEQRPAVTKIYGEFNKDSNNDAPDGMVRCYHATGSK